MISDTTLIDLAYRACQAADPERQDASVGVFLDYLKEREQDRPVIADDDLDSLLEGALATAAESAKKISASLLMTDLVLAFLLQHEDELGDDSDDLLLLAAESYYGSLRNAPAQVRDLLWERGALAPDLLDD